MQKIVSLKNKIPNSNINSLLQEFQALNIDSVDDPTPNHIFAAELHIYLIKSTLITTIQEIYIYII